VIKLFTVAVELAVSVAEAINVIGGICPLRARGRKIVVMWRCSNFKGIFRPSPKDHDMRILESNIIKKHRHRERRLMTIGCVQISRLSLKRENFDEGQFKRVYNRWVFGA